jgi:Skp family chaperone for outer membrane proteins
MRSVKTLVMLLCLVLTSVSATAGKIGFVDAERAISNVDEGKKKFEELVAWQEPRQANLDRLRDQVLSLREQLADAETEEARAEIERNQVVAVRAFEDARRDYERDLESKKDEFLATISSKIALIGQEYAKENDYDAVFLLSGQPMVYVSETANLTDTIVELYNQRYPISVD